MTYNYSAPQNNGRIVSSVDAVTGENVSYTYDSLNRLIAAATSGKTGVQWGDSYSYDGFGNLTSKVETNGTAPSVYPQVNSNTNQARMLNDYGFDANGNWLGSGAWGGSQVNTWNVENQLISDGSVDYGGNLLTYTYDPWGKRVLQYSVGGAFGPTGTLYFYSITGQRLATYTLDYLTGTQTAVSMYFGGRLLAAVDRLGSVRDTQNGSTMAYYPWGEERTSTPDGNDKFATYFRDLVTQPAGFGEDYASARYYNNNFGRFWSPDPGGLTTADPRNPQSWNRYAYAGGDPVNFNDPTGQFYASPGNPCGPSGYWFGEGCYTGNGGDPSQPQCGAAWMSDAEFSGPCTNPCAPTQSNLLPASAPNPACYATGTGPTETPLPSCGNATDQAFVQANFGGAAAAAATLGISGAVGDADILTLSAIESGWGTFKDRYGNTAYPGAWFGMQGVVGAKPYAGETACASIPGLTKYCEMEFSSFGAAAAVFARIEAGKVQGVSDPTQFFTNLKSVFAVGTSLPAYLKQMLPTEAWIQSCLKTLGLAQ